MTWCLLAIYPKDDVRVRFDGDLGGILKLKVPKGFCHGDGSIIYEDVYARG